MRCLAPRRLGDPVCDPADALDEFLVPRPIGPGVGEQDLVPAVVALDQDSPDLVGVLDTTRIWPITENQRAQASAVSRWYASISSGATSSSRGPLSKQPIQKKTAVARSPSRRATCTASMLIRKTRTNRKSASPKAR